MSDKEKYNMMFDFLCKLAIMDIDCHMVPQEIKEEAEKILNSF